MDECFVTRGDYTFHDVGFRPSEPDTLGDVFWLNGRFEPSIENPDLIRPYADKPIRAQTSFASMDLNDSGPTWPGESAGERIWRWFLLDGDICVGEGRGRRVFVCKRSPNASYWPTEEALREALPTWLPILRAAMTEAMPDCDANTTDPAQHWLYAKRRYGVKKNPYTRLAFLTKVDPEGRFRCLWEKMPDYIYRLLDAADRRLGLEVGVEDALTCENYHTLG